MKEGIGGKSEGSELAIAGVQGKGEGSSKLGGKADGEKERILDVFEDRA